MDYKSVIITVFSLFFVAQHTLTRETVLFYPCGTNLASFIQFVKWKDSVDNVWTASLNLSYYPQLTDALIEINYEPLASVIRVYNGCRIKVFGHNLTGRYWQFRPTSGMRKLYRFDVQPLALYPRITTLKVNGFVVCSNNSTLHETTTLATVNLNTAQNNQGQTNTIQNNQGQTNTIQSSQGQTNTKAHITCGRKPATYINLIFQGDESAPGQWPWHVAILYQKDKNKNKIYTCGGSLISRTTVLTAAHCVVRQGYPVDPRDVFVVAGETVLNRNIGNTQESPGKEIHVYPFYSGKPGVADIAIIKTKFCFIFNDYVQPVCIMGPEYNKQALMDLYATVMGFGLTENGTLSNVLKHTMVKIQNDATCLLSDTVYQKLLNEFNFCAGNGPNSNANPCNGDSGGGLVIEYDFGGSKHWVIQGITSVAKSRPSTNQCDPTQYVVYTAVTPYYQWIMGHL